MKTTKNILFLIAVTILLCGCKPAAQTTESQNPEAVQATNFKTVIGGFGWNLGQIIETNQELSYETNGQFSMIYLSVSTNREIYTITGCTPLRLELQPDDMKALLKALDNKYGYMGNKSVENGTAYVFGAPNSVVVYDYEDMTEISYRSPLAVKVEKQKDDDAIKSFKEY